MITRVNPLGHISLTNDYFSGLVAEAAKNCYGIAAMGQSSAASTVREALRNGSLPEKGVTVSQQEGRLGITHRVKDEVEHATGLKVARIDVFVDDIIDE